MAVAGGVVVRLDWERPQDSCVLTVQRQTIIYPVMGAIAQLS